jgi:hypothetical protein
MAFSRQTPKTSRQDFRRRPVQEPDYLVITGNPVHPLDGFNIAPLFPFIEPLPVFQR